MVRLADLDREELLALAEAYCPAEGLDLLRARLEAARRREAASYADWRRASDGAVADARAVKVRIESGRFDTASTNLMALSKISTRKAGELWAAYQKAFNQRAQLERDLSRTKT